MKAALALVPPPRPALPRVLELIRVSGAQQDARDTPQDQRRALDADRLAVPTGAIVERLEEVVSGAEDIASRPDLQRLLVLAKAKAFDEVRVRFMNRLTRHPDPAERWIIFSAVKAAGAIFRACDGTVIDPATPWARWRSSW